MGALYRLDFPSGKSYVGITMGSVESRFKKHVIDSTKGKPWAVQRALRRYGAEAVKVVTLAVSDSWEYLQLVEKNAIRVFGTFGKGGYNMTAGGEGFLGGRHTPESKAKIANASRNCSEATRRKIGDAFRGKPGSNKGAKHSAEAREAKALRQLSSGKPQGRNKSGCAGVTWSKNAGKWLARYKRHGVVHHIGVFADLAEAIAARNKAVEGVLA